MVSSLEDGIPQSSEGVAPVTEVRAAGGLVWRPLDDGAPDDFEVLVIHRPRYDDWSLPKGKVEKGEDDEKCALREVEEETGLRCAIERDLGTDRYTDRHGRPKVVRWFLMRAEHGDPHRPPATGEVPEVDDVRWMLADDAVLLLSYEHDRALVAGFDPRPTRET